MSYFSELDSVNELEHPEYDIIQKDREEEKSDVERKKPTQKELILNHMIKHGGITPLDAINLYGCFSLGSRIFELRKEGHNITTKIVFTEKGKHYAEYSIEENAR